MFENIINFFKKAGKKEGQTFNAKSKDAAKERLHLVLMQDRANVSADFLEMMKQEIIEVIKKYIDVDEKEIDVRLTNKTNEDGTTGAPALYANIPIASVKEETRKANTPPIVTEKEESKKEPEVIEEVEQKEEKPEENHEEPEKIEETIEPAEEIEKAEETIESAEEIIEQVEESKEEVEEEKKEEVKK